MAVNARLVVKLDRQALEHMLRGPNGAVMQDLWIRGNRVLNRARQLVPVDEGTLRASLAVEPVTIGGAPAVRIGSPLEYAIYVHEGTGIYGKGAPITPKSGQFLRWPVKNQSGQGRRRYKGGKTQKYAFARSVKGVPGRPFLRDALQAAR